MVVIMLLAKSIRLPAHSPYSFDMYMQEVLFTLPVSLYISP